MTRPENVTDELMEISGRLNGLNALMNMRLRAGFTLIDIADVKAILGLEDEVTEDEVCK